MTSRKACLIGLLCFALMPRPASAQTAYVSDESVTGYHSGSLYSAVMPMAFPRSFLFARGDFGNRPGVSNDYFAAGGFMPMELYGPGEVTFLEGQVWITEQNEQSIVGGTAGIGHRWMIMDYSQAVGLNGFLAWDQSANGYSYDGFSLGGEWMTDYVQATINGYVPWNDRINNVGDPVVMTQQPVFTGPNLAFRAMQGVEEQLKGMDAEIGTAIPHAEWLSAYVGVYHFDAAEENDFTGASGRVQADFNNAVFSLTVSDDDRFGTTVNFNAELRLNGGQLSFMPRYRTLDTQMHDRVRRRTRIPTLEYASERGRVLAINPADDLPYEFIHVDNTAGGGGDGTFENPFNELDLASNMPNADIILAYRGNTSPTNLLNANDGLILEDNQIVLGQGHEFFLETANFPGVFVQLPGFSGNGNNPFIGGNAGADLITLANNNTILGLNTVTDGGSAIVGSDITNVVIDEINRDFDILGGDITGTGNGIMLSNVSGVASITNVGFGIDDPTGMNGTRGISISNTDTADLDVLIANDPTEFPDLAITGASLGIELASDNSTIDALIVDINADGNGTGLRTTVTNAGDMNVAIDNSSFNDTTSGNGIEVVGSMAGSVVLTATDTTADNSSNAGLAVLVDDAAADVLVVGGSFNDAGTDAVAVEGDNNASVTVLLAETTGTGATDNGVRIQLENTSSGLVELEDTDFTGATGDGINVLLDSGSDLALMGTDSIFGDNDPMGTGDGLDVVANNGSTFQGDFDSTSFANAAGNGIAIAADGNATVATLDLSDVQVDAAGANGIQGSASQQASLVIMGDAVSGAGAGADGINLSANDAMVIAELVNTGSFAGANEDGIDLSNSNGGTLQLTVEGAGGAPADFSGAVTGNGLVSNATGMSTVTEIDLSAGATFDNAAIDAINLSSNSNATTTLVGVGVSGANAGDDGIEVTNDGGTTNVLMTETGSFAGAGAAGNGNGDGIEFNGTNGAEINLQISGVAGTAADFSGAEANGVNGSLDGSTGILVLADTNFNGPVNGSGMTVTATNGSEFGTSITDSTFNDATNGDGIQINVDGSVAIADLTNVQANNAGGDGLSLSADDTMAVGTSGIEANLDTVELDNAGGSALAANSNAGSLIDINAVDVQGSDAGANAIDLSADAGQIDLTLTSTGTNDFLNSGQSGLAFSGVNGSIINMDVSNTDFSDPENGPNTGRGAHGDLTDSSAILNLTDVNFDYAGLSGIELAANNSTITGIWENVSAIEAGFDALTINASAASDIDLEINNFTGTLAGRDGLSITSDGAGTEVDLLIDTADFSDAMLNGLAFNLNNDSVVTVDTTNVIADNATNDAINVLADNNSILTLDITNGSLLNAGDDMTDVTFFNGAVVNLTIDPTPATGAADNGLEFNGASGGTLNFTMIDSPLSTEADPVGTNGILGFLDAATANLSFINSDIDNSSPPGATGDAVAVTGTNGSIFNLDLDNSSMDNWNNGLNLTMTDSTANVDLMTGNSIDNALGSAILVNADNSTVNITGTETSIAASTGNAIDLTGTNGSIIGVTLADTTSLSSSTGDAVNFGGSDSEFNISIDGTAAAPLVIGAASGSGVVGNVVDSSVTLAMSDFTVDGAAGNGIDLTLGENGNGGSTLEIDLLDFSLSGNGESGLVIDLDGSTLLDSNLDNGLIQNNGLAGNPSFGISVSANNNSSVGNRGTVGNGLDMMNLMIGNTDPLAKTQDVGIYLSADNESYLETTVVSSVIDLNDGNGVEIITNADMNIGDGSLIEASFLDSNILNNCGDGVNLRAFFGNNTPGDDPMNETSGIVFSFAGDGTTTGLITGNGNGNVGDGIGDGIDAVAQGDAGGGPENTTITINLSNAMVTGNEEMDLRTEMPDNGEINLGIFDVTIGDGIEICADGSGDATLNLNNVIITGVTGQAAIAMVAEGGGTATGTFTNVMIRDNEAQAFAFRSTGAGSVVDAVFNNTIMMNNAFNSGITDSKTGLDVDAQIQGLVEGGGTANITFNGVTATQSPAVNGLEIDVTTGGTLNLDIDDLSLTNNTGMAGEGEFDVDVDGAGSIANIDIDGLTASDSEGRGVDIEATGGGALNLVQLNDITANNATDEGLNITGDLADADGIVAITDSSFNNAGNGDGVNIDLTTTSATDLSLTNVSANGATNGDGIDLTVTGSAAGGTHSMTLNDVQADDAGGTGASLTINGLAATDSAAFDISNGSSFDNAGADGIEISTPGAVAGSTSTVSVSDTTAVNATGNGFIINPSDISITDVTLTDLNVDNAGENGIDVRLANQAAATSIALTNVNANNAGTAPAGIDPLIPGDGILIELDNVGGGATNTLSFDGVQASNAIGGDGIDLRLDNGTVAEFTAFDNVTARNNQQTGLRFDIDNASQLMTFASTGLDVSNNSALSTMDAGILVDVTGGSSADFDLTDLTIDNTVANFGAGVLLNVDGASTLGFDITGSSLIDMTGREGVDVAVANGSTFTGTFEGLDILNGGTAPMVQVNGFDLDVTGVGSSATIVMNDVSANNHQTGDGINLIASGGALLDATLSNGVTANGNRESGLDVFATGNGTELILSSMTAMGGMVNTFNNNGFPDDLNNDGGHGVSVVLEDLVEATLMLEASASNNAGDGIRVITDDSGVTINDLGITASNVNVNGNDGNGLTIDLDSVVGINSFDLSGITVMNNTMDQINASFTDMVLDTVSFNQVTATGPGAGTGMGDGIELTLDNTQVTTLLGLNNIRANNNGEDGLQFNLLNGSTIPMGSAIDLTMGVMSDSSFSNNGEHGINITVNSSVAELDILNSQSPFGRTSTIANNGGNGVNIEIENGGSLISAIDQQIIDMNSGSGINVIAGAGVGDSFFSTGDGITNNQITDNGSFGVRVTQLSTIVDNVPDLDVSIGSRTIDGQGNIIDGNQDAGIAIDLIQNTIGQVAIRGNQITNTSNGANADFSGEAIFIRMLGTLDPNPAQNLLNANGTGIGDGLNNVTPGLLIENNLIGVDEFGMVGANATTGINFDVRESSTIDGLHILNNTISNAQNGGDGIRFNRIDDVVVNDFFIDENIIENNGDDGIDITAENDDNSAMEVIIGLDGQRDGLGGITGTDTDVRSDISNWLASLDGNYINNNANDGIVMQVNADAGLIVDMEENQILNNGNDGVQLLEVVQDQSDGRFIAGLWEQNVIANNANFGFVTGARLAGLSMNDGIVGAIIDQFGNVMTDGNGSTGMVINGAGVSAYDDLDIVRNGRLVTGDRSLGHGVDIQGVGFKQVAMTNSLVRENFQDGVEILQTDQNGTIFDFVLDFEDNRVVANMGRGFDILKRGDGEMFITITGTNDPRNNPLPLAQVSSNDEEGIYVVNTSSNTQNQTDFSNAALAQDGPVTETPQLELLIDQVQISNNGNVVLATLPNNLPGSGLVVRVGTSDGNYSLIGAGSTAQNGGFATDGFGNVINGGVGLEFTSSTLQGNFGDDVFFHSYTSTGNPANVGGTWNDMTFDPTNVGRGDPLARFDVVWGTGAEAIFFDSIDVTNSLRAGTPGGEAGAFYNGPADGTFISRTRDNNNPPLGGPFTAGGRRRNATRLALRNYPDFALGEMVNLVDTLGPTGTPNPNTSGSPFLYPGMGDSTMRVSASSGNQLDLPFDFILDGNAGNGFQVDDRLDINGVSFTPGVIFGELPFGWGSF
ncbi:hypothetical protein AB1L42_20625 [Thalassoglobus sp. JC818]|uniref:hypothetical protein n=1 Tax=Thalassoglobus sp. JC818 TaxID=3232136 RepID=UPI0034597059